MLEKLTPEERIGQLFLVTFKGKDISANSDISNLISQLHIGGVILKRENGNWRSGDGEAAAVLQLSNGLQQLSAGSQQEGSLDDGAGYIPLFISLAEEGNGYPYDQLQTEITVLPSEMAIGAAWQPELAREAGRVLGGNLADLGINMLLSPSLDVLERPNPGTTGDLGIRAFGGDPFWVGQIGQAYVTGLQEGSGRKLAVIVTHFPGIGGSDRSPDEEVATIRKTLEELRQIDLAPFATLAGEAPGQSGIADGFLVSHIRYQGLQGNIRASTRPVSLDPQALGQLLALPEFQSWRDAGGITVSDSLGTQSVRKFYDPTGATFSNRYIALNALQAGNDILQLSDFFGTESGSEYATISETVSFFQQRYLEDKTFAGQVDQAVLRILTLKYRLYPEFSLENVLGSDDQLAGLKEGAEISSDICLNSATLINPVSGKSAGTEIEPPTAADRILILTDSRQMVPCPGCVLEYDIAPTAMANMILSLYGPGASGFVGASRISSFTFHDLDSYLQGDTTPEFETALTNSTLIVALLRNPTSSSADSRAFQDFLSQRTDLVAKKKVIVFSLAAPYYLDSTEISKLDAYYAMYSKIDACIEVAARILYGDLTPAGASPVSVDGVGYSLLTALSPDPDQIIQISVVPLGESDATLAPSPTFNQTMTLTMTPQGYSWGDRLSFVAGPVVDHNGHPVPDGTILRFRIEYPAEDIPPLYLDASLTNGLAQVEYVLERKGELQVSASSDPAIDSTIIRLTVGEKPGFITAIAPTIDLTASPTAGEAVTPVPQNTPVGGGKQDVSTIDSFLLLIFLLAILSGGSMVVASSIEPGAPRLRLILGILAGGLAGYDYIAAGLPGADWLVSVGGSGMGVVFGLLGSILGAAVFFVWFFRKNRKTSQH